MHIYIYFLYDLLYIELSFISIDIVYTQINIYKSIQIESLKKFNEKLSIMIKV